MVIFFYEKIYTRNNSEIKKHKTFTEHEFNTHVKVRCS